MDLDNTTSFSVVYNSFLSKITDDMYMELTREDTENMLEELLISRFPRFDIFNYELGRINQVTNEYEPGYFNHILTQEEVNIISTYMIVEWLGQQLASIENMRMKYSGTDFKFTSQANHMQKILTIKKDYEREGFHLQRLYKRRIFDKDGIARSTFGDIMNNSDVIYIDNPTADYLDIIM